MFSSLSHPKRQGRPSLGTSPSDANVLKVDSDRIPFSTCFPGLAGYKFLYDSCWPSHLLCLMDGTKRSKCSLMSLIARFLQVENQRKGSCLQLLPAVHLAEVVAIRKPLCKHLGAGSCWLTTPLPLSSSILILKLHPKPTQGPSVYHLPQDLREVAWSWYNESSCLWNEGPSCNDLAAPTLRLL